MRRVPADLAKLRAAHDHAATYASPSTYPASPAVYRSPNPAAFASMFGASPADLAAMRRGADASSSASVNADPSRFDDMYGASPAQLTKMRAAHAAGNYASVSSSSHASYSSAHAPLSASSDRFVVVDIVAKDEADAREKILAICLEQTVELPESLVPEGTWIREHVVGKLESLTKGEGLGGSWRCEISYHADTAGGEMTQLVNVIFGNTSMKEGVMVADVRMPPGVLRDYPGPKFGVEGLRRLVGVPEGQVMLMTALKPMGSSTAELARMAYEFAKGGIDIIKDDHGLADQPYSRYDERIRACAKAVARANAETGRRCVYAPCVCAPAHLVISRAHAARRRRRRRGADDPRDHRHGHHEGTRRGYEFRAAHHLPPGDAGRDARRREQVARGGFLARGVARRAAPAGGSRHDHLPVVRWKVRVLGGRVQGYFAREQAGDGHVPRDLPHARRRHDGWSAWPRWLRRSAQTSACSSAGPSWVTRPIS